MPFYEDNSAALRYIHEPYVRGRMKHIDMAYQVVKEYAEQGYIAPERCLQNSMRQML